MHDIYNPPPAPAPWSPPKPERLNYTFGDVAFLVALIGLLGLASALAWSEDPSVAVLTAVGGALVLTESWFTALGILNRFKPLGLRARWTIFLAALLPWMIGLGIAALLLMGLFWVSDNLA